VECDEVHIVAGYKGHPEMVRAQGRWGRRRRLKGAPGRGTLAKEKPSIFGMIQRGGEVVIQMPPTSSSKPFSPSSVKLSNEELSFLPMNMPFVNRWKPGALRTRRSIMGKLSTLEMTTGWVL